MSILFLVIGLAAGVLSGIFGIGGGVVIVPLLVFFAGMTPQAAAGTSLGALLLPVGALGAWSYYKQGQINIPASGWIALGLFAGAYFGARASLPVSPVVMRRSFAILLVLMAGKLWFTP